MKILHILNEIRPSGAEVMLKTAAGLWQENNMQLAALSTGEATGPYAGILAEAGFTIYHIPFRKSPLFFRQVYQLIKSEAFEVVHVHTERASLFYCLLARSAGVRRIVRTIHSTFRFQGFLKYRRHLTCWIEKRLGVTHTSISPSVQEVELAYSHNPTLLVPNWYDDRKFRIPDASEKEARREALGIPAGHPVLISVGNCGEVKNHTAILQALAKLKDQYSFTYLHLGIEQPGYPERVLAESLGIDKYSQFLGYLADVWPFLSAADVFVMPSLYEGLPLAALEAMASGLTAVLSDVSGLRDYKKSVPFILWSGTDPGSIAQCVAQAINLGEEARVRQGLENSAIVREAWGLAKGANSYLYIYENDSQRLDGRGWPISLGEKHEI